MEFTDNFNCHVMAWPTSEKEYRLRPLISFLVKKNEKVNLNDTVSIVKASTKAKQNTTYRICEIQSDSKSHRTGYRQIICKIEKLN